MRLHYPSDAEWTQGRVHNLPKRWADLLLTHWRETKESDYASANKELRVATESLLRVRIPLDASDSEICSAAKLLADTCSKRAELFHDVDALRAAMERVCAVQGIAPPSDRKANGPAIARMVCSLWWRRQLRKHQAQTVETQAIRLGLVSKVKNLYVSEERLRARLQQNARNVETLEHTIARNEMGQEFTLSELASRSTANKKIRRAELMTRIAGFERIAQDMNHAGMFITITCPSRFHRWRTVNGGRKVLENPKYDPNETPATAQRYLARVWARIRSSLARQKISLYGFRISEPQHDGTPHWHLLVFFQQDAAEQVTSTVRKYALQDSPEEIGASTHRCDFKVIDHARGSAAGYIAKYIAKNIDGEHVGEDLNGRPATETALRVDAWASTWRIRQFQQIGGPPVGPWRELRRVKEVPEQGPDHLKEAHQAANKLAKLEDRENASVAWDRYCKAQGGIFIGREYRIRITTAEREGLGRYGEPLKPSPVGVETTSRETYTPAHMAHIGGHRRA